MAAAIGLDPADLKDPQGRPRQEQVLALFAPADRLDLLADDGIFLTEAIARELKLTDADIGRRGCCWAG